MKIIFKDSRIVESLGRIIDIGSYNFTLLGFTIYNGLFDMLHKEQSMNAVLHWK